MSKEFTLRWRWLNTQQPFTIHSDDFCHLLALAREHEHSQWRIYDKVGWMIAGSKNWQEVEGVEE